jgi:hypothetical protein
MPELPAEARPVPWATDDAVVSAHRWSAARWLASVWPFWVALGFWAALVVSVVVDPPRHLTPPKLAALTAGILAVILALFGFVLYMAAWRLGRRTRAFYVFPDGFVYQDTAGDWGACRWAGVREAWRAETMHHGVVTRSHVRLVTADADLLLDRSLNDYSALADDVETRVARGQLPDLLRRYRAGERLAFGPVGLDTAGVYLRDRAFPLAEVKGVRLVDGALVVVGPPLGIWKGNGARARDVPNLPALLALLNVNPWAALKPAGG